MTLPVYGVAVTETPFTRYRAPYSQNERVFVTLCCFNRLRKKRALFTLPAVGRPAKCQGLKF